MIEHFWFPVPRARNNIEPLPREAVLLNLKRRNESICLLRILIETSEVQKNDDELQRNLSSQEQTRCISAEIQVGKAYGLVTKYMELQQAMKILIYQANPVCAVWSAWKYSSSGSVESVPFAVSLVTEHCQSAHDEYLAIKIIFSLLLFVKK